MNWLDALDIDEADFARYRERAFDQYRIRLLAHVARRGRAWITPEQVRDVTQDALADFCDGNRAIQAEKSMAAVLGSLANGRLNNLRRRPVPRPLGGEPLPGHGATPEANVAAMELSTRISIRLRDDPMALGVFICFLDGICEASVQARFLGASVTEIYRARRRVRDAAEDVR